MFFFSSVKKNDVKKIINKSVLNELDFLSLLSPVAQNFMEDMAKKSNQLTKQHFGNVIFLFTPIYISNFCVNNCLYCGFNHNNKITRTHLEKKEIETEAKKIARTGLKHILFLTGEAPNLADIDYLKNAVLILKKYFTSIGIETYALTSQEYEALIKKGLDLLTIYQETYNEKLYAFLHKKGPKKNYKFRLDAPQRALEKNIRAVNVGALLGLDDFRKDFFFSALHAKYLQDKFLDAEISVSLLRIRPHEGVFQPKYTVSDKNFVQLMTAFRIFMPRCGITISTRESKQFRNNILKLGVTKMSADSVTSVGGRSGKKSTNQFDISDKRNVIEIAKDLKKLGHQVIYKDWQGI